MLNVINFEINVKVLFHNNNYLINEKCLIRKYKNNGN